MLQVFEILCCKHSLKSGPEARDPGSQDPGPWDLGLGTLVPLKLGPWDFGLATLGHGTLTPLTLEMGPSDPETSN